MGGYLKEAPGAAGPAVLRRRVVRVLPGMLLGAALTGATVLPAPGALAAPPEASGSGCAHGEPGPSARQEEPFGAADERRAVRRTPRATASDCPAGEAKARVEPGPARPSGRPAQHGRFSKDPDEQHDEGRHTDEYRADAPQGGREQDGGEQGGREKSGRGQAGKQQDGQPGGERAEPQDGTGLSRPERLPARADLAALAPPLLRGVAPGETFDYTITVVNHGPAQATNVTATDELPAVLSFVSSKDGCTADGQEVLCGPVARLAPGDSASWVVTVRLDPAYTGDGSDIRNQATAMSDTFDPDPANNTGPHPGAGPPDGTVERPRTDLAVGKEFTGPDPVVPGTVFGYTLTAVNLGPSQATGVSLTDRLPDGLAFVDSPDGCTGEAGAYGTTVTCPAATDLAPDGHTAFTIRVRLDPGYTGDGSDLVNRVRARADTDDRVPENNTAELAGLPGGDGGPAPASADLVLAKRYELPDGTDAATPGETYAYVMTVRNQGPSTARDVTVTDPLPRALSFDGSPDGCTAEGATVTCGGSDRLGPGESAEYRITVRLDRDFDGDCATVDNTARVSSAVDDPDPADNTASVGAAARGAAGDCGVPIRPLPSPSPSPTHHGDEHGDHQGHHGHALPDTGNGTPGWLPWAAGLTLTAGAGLVVGVRRRRA
ncbi:LPXTG cell wall anchor domain-containing protein [Streptomyces sp. KLOTTS4A1]|uniref:LPXTG cell wall anchor domain-containing protein n=1 Tax=Streptomyces sp. KLOTTS4A1 TaxID=3390996 RepID=UPI0039F44CA9